MEKYSKEEFDATAERSMTADGVIEHLQGDLKMPNHPLIEKLKNVQLGEWVEQKKVFVARMVELNKLAHEEAIEYNKRLDELKTAADSVKDFDQRFFPEAKE